jgi:hypothetical protein
MRRLDEAGLSHRLMVGRFADWFNSRLWFIRYLLFAEWVLVVALVSLVAISLWEFATCERHNRRVLRCAFCPRLSSGKWAVTAQDREGNWRREVLPICARCNRLIGEAGREGRALKATGERWFPGHTVGLFPAKGMEPP